MELNILHIGDGISSIKHMNYDVPRGSILGPMFFILYFAFCFSKLIAQKFVFFLCLTIKIILLT